MKAVFPTRFHVDIPADESAVRKLREELKSGKMLAFIAPRGVGPTAWSTNSKDRILVRRRFMLLGQTLDGMRVWDIRRALQALQSMDKWKGVPISLEGREEMGVNVLYASLFESGINRVILTDIPASHDEGPDYLNVLKIMDIPQALSMAAERAEIVQR